MDVEVLVFGPIADLSGRDRVLVRVRDEGGVTVGRVAEALAEQAPGIGDMARSGRLAVNARYVPAETFITASDEVALIALVSGG